MQQNQRREKLVELLREQGEVTIPVLAQLLKVTEMTVHRDLDFLESQELLKKKRGGAIYIETKKMKTEKIYSKEKEAIAKEAIKLIEDGDSIIFDNSTTAFEVASRLHKFHNLTIYATNIEIANMLSQNEKIILFCSGGLYFRPSTGFVGKEAEDFISKVHAAKCFIGTSGISPEYGLTGPYHSHVDLERKIIAASDQVIVVADHTKFGKVAIDKVTDLQNVDYIITDSKVDPVKLDNVRKFTRVIVAGVI
jgi:DeoR family fructose operon transcriptional repressor